MLDEENLSATLKRIAEHIELDENNHLGLDEAKCIRRAAGLIERTTKPMTLERAVDFMNEVHHEGASDWEIVEYSNGREAYSLWAGQDYGEFAAIAVAEKIEREKEAANG